MPGASRQLQGQSLDLTKLQTPICHRWSVNIEKSQGQVPHLQCTAQREAHHSAAQKQARFWNAELSPTTKRREKAKPNIETVSPSTMLLCQLFIFLFSVPLTA